MNQFPSNNHQNWKAPQNNNQFFYNPFTNNSSYQKTPPPNLPKLNAQSPSFNQNFQFKKMVNVSTGESSDNLTPRPILSGRTAQEEIPQYSQEKINPQLKLNHLFGMSQRNTAQGHLNHSYLSTASSHDSEENPMRLNNSCVFSNPFTFQQKTQHNYSMQNYNKVKSLHISSNQQKKIEEQEEKDDEDFILNISKFYINNIEEDPNETLKITKQTIIEEKKKAFEPKLEIPKEKKNVVFEISSRNKLDVPRKKRNFPEGDSEKYDIDINNIEKDGRTTLMIKNIPNKYNLDSLLEIVKKNHVNKYNFFYLPIDFNNKCNVGYAFINFADAKFIKNFYLEFNGRKWEKYNSEKICLIKYARIQGLEALISHFQFSSVMNKKDKNVRPVILNNIERLVHLQKTKESQKYE